MQLKHFLVVVATAGAVIGSSACSTPTTLSETWRDPNYTATAPLRKVLVMARLHSEANRRSIEDAYVAALGQHGVRAMASYQVFQEQRPDREAVRRYLQTQDYDGALVTRFEGMRSQTRVVPNADFGWYYGYWGDDYYLETDQYLKVESSLWDARSGKLIWSATSETENPSSSGDAISSVVSKITSSLVKERLIPPAGPAVSYAPRERAY